MPVKGAVLDSGELMICELNSQSNYTPTLQAPEATCALAGIEQFVQTARGT